MTARGAPSISTPGRLRPEAAVLRQAQNCPQATQYAALVSLVIPASLPGVVLNDADDDHVIAAAVAARAELIATGDHKHLLPIDNHQGVAVVTAREVADKLEANLRLDPHLPVTLVFRKRCSQFPPLIDSTRQSDQLTSSRRFSMRSNRSLRRSRN